MNLEPNLSQIHLSFLVTGHLVFVPLEQALKAWMLFLYAFEKVPIWDIEKIDAV